MNALFLILFSLLAQDSPLDQALKEAGAQPKPDLASARVGQSNLRLIDLSLDSLLAAGASNQRDNELQNLQGGGHDPRKRGFTIQNVELSAKAAVDPYFNAEAHLVYLIDPIGGESVFELEEAFAVTQALPFGLQIKAGQYFTEFGRLNSQHPHQWDFLDQPVILTRLFGPDGLRGPGLRTAWLLPLPFFSEFIGGLQNANGETMASFYASEEYYDERSIGGRRFVAQDVRNLGDLLYSLRWHNSFELGGDVTALFGGSALFGPNASGDAGQTRIYGVDLRFKWRPAQNERGWPFVIWQSEVLYRDYKAEGQAYDPDGIPVSGDEFFVDSEHLLDYGLVTQLLWGFMKDWAVGIRFECANGRGDSVDSATGADATRTDPFRDRRIRASALLAWNPTEFSRLRLQYSFDDAEHLEPGSRDEQGHTIWLGMEVMIGAHAAHSY